MKIGQIDFVNPRHGEGFSKYGVYCQPYGGEIIRQIVRTIDPSIRFRIVDETRGDRIDYQGDVMFGTAYTYPVKRLYQIAQGYRRRGKTAVLGGIHVSAISKYPEISSNEYQNADAVVIGEGESVIPGLIVDLQNDRLKKTYIGHAVEPKTPVLCEEPLHWGWAFPVQLLRGCPWWCEFCSVPVMFGGKYRQRPLDFILKEIQHYHTQRGKTNTLLFLDDDINDPKSIYPILNAIHDKFGYVKGGWTSATDMNLIVNFKGIVNEKFLSLANKTNCASLYFGFENVTQSVLKEYGVRKNSPRYYQRLAKACHEYGITAWGSTIISPLSSNWKTVEFMVDWYNSIDIDVMGWTILTPLPATALFDKIYKEGRIYTGNDVANSRKVAWLDLDWSKYDVCHTVWLPEGSEYSALEYQSMRDWAMKHYERGTPRNILLTLYYLLRKKYRPATRHWMKAGFALKNAGMLPDALVKRAYFGKNRQAG